MGALYVTEQGAMLRRTGERLLVTKDNELVQDVPIVHIDQVVIVGNIQITTPAVALLLQKEIDVVFMSVHGKYRGRLMTTGSKFAELRHRQLRLVENDALVLSLARSLVVAKLNGQAALLRRLEPSRKAVAGIEQATREAQRASSLNALRGYEGSGAAAFFGGLQALFPAQWGFARRVYHPPTDRINALLSLGYTLLLKDAMAATQLVGLDPYVGVFHALDYGRPSLCLDLIEPFRPVVDGLVVSLVSSGRIAWDEFSERKQDRAMLLTDGARKRYLQAYEDRMARRTPANSLAADAEAGHPGPAEQTTVRRCIELESRAWARVVMGKSKGFVPFVARE